MTAVTKISIEQIKPEQTGVFLTQGIPPGVSPSPSVLTLYESAEQLFLSLAEPVGISADISVDIFDKIYSGNGLNETNTPLEKIFPEAENLSLFVFTLGGKISHEIDEQFKSNNLALGYMLDAIASFCTDKASLAAQRDFMNCFKTKPGINANRRALLYSPGYCGWHISGQKKLFDYLKPEKIGVCLNDSFLMVPLKSISGVLIEGKSDIHKFKNNYPFCQSCKNKTCRKRVNN